MNKTVNKTAVRIHRLLFSQLREFRELCNKYGVEYVPPVINENKPFVVILWLEDDKVENFVDEFRKKFQRR